MVWLNDAEVILKGYRISNRDVFFATSNFSLISTSSPYVLLGDHSLEAKRDSTHLRYCVPRLRMIQICLRWLKLDYTG